MGSINRFMRELVGYHAAGLERRPCAGSFKRAFLERLSRSGVSRREAWLRILGPKWRVIGRNFAGAHFRLS